MKSKRARALDISQDVKKRVFERDGGRCVICGNACNVMPNSHFIPRSRGGLGIEENVVTMCSNFTDNQCHRKYEEVPEMRAEMEEQIREYLKGEYPNWDESKLTYSKYGGAL
jgi:5-methylcytosine-specific restriction endonuclease McrA